MTGLPYTNFVQIWRCAITWPKNSTRSLLWGSKFWKVFEFASRNVIAILCPTLLWLLTGLKNCGSRRCSWSFWRKLREWSTPIRSTNLFCRCKISAKCWYSVIAPRISWSGQSHFMWFRWGGRKTIRGSCPRKNWTPMTPRYTFFETIDEICDLFKNKDLNYKWFSWVKKIR